MWLQTHNQPSGKSGDLLSQWSRTSMPRWLMMHISPNWTWCMLMNSWFCLLQKYPGASWMDCWKAYQTPWYTLMMCWSLAQQNCQFLSAEVTYLGHKADADGIQAYSDHYFWVEEVPSIHMEPSCHYCDRPSCTPNDITQNAMVGTNKPMCMTLSTVQGQAYHMLMPWVLLSSLPLATCHDHVAVPEDNLLYVCGPTPRLNANYHGRYTFPDFIDNDTLKGYI